MPLGAARIALFSRPQVVAEEEIIPFNGAINSGGIFNQTDNTSSIATTADDWTVSYWFKMQESATSDQRVFQWFFGSGASGNKLLVRFKTNGDLQVFIVNSFKYLHNFSSEFSTTGDNDWHHMVLSNKASTSSYECYVDGVNINLSTAIPTQIDFTNLAGYGVGASQTGGGASNSGIGQFALWYGTAYDLSANISKFYDNGIVNMGSNGTATGLDQPTIYHAGNTNYFNTNRGNGNFTLSTDFVSGSIDDVIS